MNVALTLAAEEDLTDIWQYTYETWGFDQAEKYYDMLVASCDAIKSGSAHVKPVRGLAEEICVHHCQQHYIFFTQDERPVILAILHGRMDLIRRLKERF